MERIRNAIWFLLVLLAAGYALSLVPFSSAVQQELPVTIHRDGKGAGARGYGAPRPVAEGRKHSGFL